MKKIQKFQKIFFKFYQRIFKKFLFLHILPWEGTKFNFHILPQGQIELKNRSKRIKFHNLPRVKP